MSDQPISTSFDVYNTFGKLIEKAAVYNQSTGFQKIDLMLKNEMLLQLTKIKEILDSERKNS